MAKGMNCRTCVLQKYLGCEEDISPVDVWGYRVTRCTRRIAQPVDFIYIQLYAEWKKGNLPNVGAWLDQPMKLGAVMAVIDGLMDKVEKE